MFLVNSRCHHFSATRFRSGCKILHVLRAYLLPRLRYHFAEFLNQGSLKRLGILTLPTCVGLRYDHLIISLEAFLGSLGSMTLRTNVLGIASQGYKETDLPVSYPYLLTPPIPTDGSYTLLRHPVTQSIIRWYRNFNLFPIAYALQPRLRVSTNPEKISFTQESLGFRRAGFSPALSLLMPASALIYSPLNLTV